MSNEQQSSLHRKAKRSSMKQSTYEVDIAQEFHEVKMALAEGNAKLNEKLDGFKEEISGWKSVFDKQLSQLNANMDKALSAIADHEARLTKIEEKHLRDQTRKETISDIASFGWAAAKIALVVGALIGAVGGCGWILKILAVI